MKKYTVNFRSHFRHLWLLIFLLIVCPIAIHYVMSIKIGDYTHEDAWFVGRGAFVIFILPMLLLHLNYYLESIGNYLFYDRVQGVFIYGNGKSETKFSLNDVESITCYKSKAMAENRTPFFPWDIYNYAKIELKKGDSIKLSSLLVYEFDKEIKFDKIKIKKTFYPWIV